MADSFINKLTENIRLNPEDYCIFDMYDNVLNVFNSEKISYATLANQLSSLIYDKVNTEFVHISGDRLTGFLTLHQHPISSMHAATKSYVDNLSASFRNLLSGLSSDISRGSLKSAVSSITIASPNNTLTITNPTISSSSGTINVDVNSVPLDKLGSGGAYGGQVLVFDQSTQTYVPSSISTSGGGGGGGTIVNNVDNTPIGTINYFAASAAPVGYLVCDGAIVKKSDYVDLYAVIKDTYTTVLSAGHFKLPDLRGEFVRGWDNGRNVNTGRVFGSNESDAFQGHWHELLANAGTVDPSINSGSNGIPSTPPANLVRNAVTDGVNGTPRTASETRPRNVALLPCIKALRTVTGPTSVVQINSVNSFTINGSMLAKAWVSFNGKKDTTGANSTSNTNRLINASYNVDSVLRTAEGKYTINFKAGTFDSPNYTYAVGVGAVNQDNSQTNAVYYGDKSSSAIQIIANESGINSERDDLPEMCFTFYASGGDLTGSANVFDSTPVGTINYFAASAAPVGYLECNGAAVSKSDYSDLFSVIGNTYTSVVSANHFRVPDLRGEFIRGWDKGRGVDAGRTLGSWQKGTLAAYDVAGQAAVVNISYETDPPSYPVVSLAVSQSGLGYDAYNRTDYATQAKIYAVGLPSSNSLPDWGGTNEAGSGTTRPRNVALLPCIKAQKTVTGTTQTLNFIEKPASPIDDGAFLRYQSSTKTWVAGAGGGGSTTILTTSEPALGLPLRSWSHYNGCFYGKNQLYMFGYSPATFSIDSYASRPTRIPFDENYLMRNTNVSIIKVIDSPLNTFVLLSDGTFWGAGNCSIWQDIYSTAANYTFQLIKLNSMFANKAVRDFSMATANDNQTTVGIICTDGTVYAWGYNGFGQLGNASSDSSTSPVLINIAGKTISQISVGGWSNSGGNIFLRMSDGTLYAAGYNAHGQLGNNSTTSTLDRLTQKTFTQCLESTSAPITNVAQICETGSMNQIFTRYIIKTDGTVWSTGLNDAGQLGITSLAAGTNSSYFRKVNLPNGIVATKVVNSGWSAATTVAALDSNGNVYAWGYTGHGQTGAGTPTAFNTPTKVTVYQKNLNDTATLPAIKDIFGATCSNAGAIGLISVDKQLYTAGVYTYAPITLMKTQTRHTDSYYRFELANVENVEEGMFYCNNTGGGEGYTVGTIVRDSGGIIWAWGVNNGGIIHPVEGKNVAKPTRINY